MVFLSWVVGLRAGFGLLTVRRVRADHGIPLAFGGRGGVRVVVGLVDSSWCPFGAR